MEGIAQVALRFLNLARLATKVFGLNARRGESPSWVKDELKDPVFSTVLGIFQFGLRGAHEHAVPPRRKTGFLSSLTKIFASS